MFSSRLTALFASGPLVALAACSTTTVPTQPPPPPPITLSAVLTDTSYAGGLAHLRVAFSTSAPATVDLSASDGTLTSTGPTTYDWAVSPQIASHRLYGCAVASGACAPDTTTALLTVGQLPQETSLLVTSTVTAGYIQITWHRFLGDSGDTVISSPVPSPGVCYRFTTAPGDSIAWKVVANDSAWVQGTSASTSLMPATGAERRQPARVVRAHLPRGQRDPRHRDRHRAGRRALLGRSPKDPRRGPHRAHLAEGDGQPIAARDAEPREQPHHRIGHAPELVPG